MADRRRRESGGRVLVGLLPVWIYLVRLIAAPASLDPAFANPPAFAGLPLGVILLGVALLVMAIGVEILRRSSSNRTTLLTFVGLTLPSAVLVVVTPALVLMSQNAAV